MKKTTFLMALLVIASIVLTGCECEAESDGELCGERQCGTWSLVDRCGADRIVECGACGQFASCQEGQCACEAESDGELCDIGLADCGMLSISDRCGVWREVDCGECLAPGECLDNHCDCSDEGPETLCDNQGLECGPAEVVDSCLASRSVDCGDCDGSYDCVENLCRCDGESEEELCAQGDGLCGQRQVVDSCDVVRQVQCQPCAQGNTTFGAVIDGQSGELVDDALIRVYAWPPAGGEHFEWVWDADYRAGDPDYVMSTSAAGVGGDVAVNYEFASEEPICHDGGQVAWIEPHRYYRIRVDRPGYRPAIFYRYHDGYRSADCPSSCLASQESGCHRQDFEIWPDGATYPLYPNLMVDVRDLEDLQWQCALLPDDADHQYLVGVRVSAGIANVGPGPFGLEGGPGGVDDEQGVVLQQIRWSDGESELRAVESDFFDYYSTGTRVNLMAWVRLGLVEPTEECRDVDDRPESCLSHTEEKISFCLHDSDRFDEDMKFEYDGLSSLFTNPPTCGSFLQGITPGWKDVYARRLPAQAIILGPPDEASLLGQRWIELEVDPRRILNEEDRSLNVGRLLVDIPSDAAALCDDSETLLDCTVPADEYSNVQRWQCPGYLNFSD